MKKILCTICAFGMLLLLSCGADEAVGKDWHVWGVYEFVTVNDMTVAVKKAYNDDGKPVGYDLFADGKGSPGALLGEIRCEDGGYTFEDVSEEYSLTVGDCDGDGLEDFGFTLKNGDVLWYTQLPDTGNVTEFRYSKTEAADNQ